MEPLAVVDSLSPIARKILDRASPAPLRTMAAKGIAPGVRPPELLTVVVLLSRLTDPEDAALQATALATLDKLPAQLLHGAL
ncbi:MAG TPA: hypothetical protein VK841_05870, partial [Polyangiaceae bacterium]|nr:hypothetical protein [Polyangiaceae bacterium]